ncbi:CopG family transcriptional regulator [Paracoccus gahaiensis]|uniref:CopG family transcriptional regulator n=1 Tax=Paracoccus gahaiensis TaxID=1706839 RepID=A0A4U0R9U5_9RHOB|nr:CopG family transcriptional regulator [Paracoccus gahaiensis]TJZ91981.1 CopG family transcriptional regulator [Paracoccus gahaiensis]
MASPSPARTADTEKITINLGFVDLGRIDLLVREGFYASRSDLIRTAIRAQLDRHDTAVAPTIIRDDFVMGLRDVTLAELQGLKAANQMLDLRVIGLARFARDIPAELVTQTIRTIEVLGTLQADAGVKSALDACRPRKGL